MPSVFSRTIAWSRARPRFQVVISRYTPRPTTIGNQPPSSILMTLALKKATSTSRSAAVSARARQRGHFHRSHAMVWSRSVVVSIVPVTATPYAAARLLECRKPTTSVTQPSHRAQFTSGM